MKRALFGIALLLAGALPPAAMAAGPARTVEMTVDGMVCAFCAQGIEKKLRALDATDDVYISLERHLVALSLKGPKDVSDEQLRRILTDSGYTVRTVKRSHESLARLREAASS